MLRYSKSFAISENRAFLFLHKPHVRLVKVPHAYSHDCTLSWSRLGELNRASETEVPNRAALVHPNRSDLRGHRHPMALLSSVVLILIVAWFRSHAK